MRVISYYKVNELNAGPKAKVDIEYILKKEYNAKIRSLKTKCDLTKKINLFFFRLKRAFFIIFNRYAKDITIYQLPYNKSCNHSIKSQYSVGLIHDINGLREKDDTLLHKEIEHLKKMDVIISHNDIMTKFLIDNGVTIPIINLEIFDYLVKSNKKHAQSKNNGISIAFAGNFEKSLFLNELEDKKMKFMINLYGVGKFNENNKKLKYYGSFSPDELPIKLEGDLGLVWDGSINNNVENNYLNYTKYNNPHKLSCYIAAGLPVIVWEEAACAKFVKKENIGYVISSIYDINKLDFSDYEKKIENVKRIQERVINGKYTIDAINKALDIINKRSK